jgi:hypothetical protein
MRARSMPSLATPPYCCATAALQPNLSKPKVSAPPYSSKNSNQHCKHQLAKVQVFSPRRSHVEPTHVEPKHPPDFSGFGRQYFAQPYWHVAIEDRLTCHLGADVCMLIDGGNSNWLNLTKLIQYLCEAKSEGNML